MYHAITEVKPLINYTLELIFDSKEIRIFDLEPYLSVGRFRELADIGKFRQVKVKYDTIEWLNGLDLDPEFLYAKSIKIK